MKTYKIELSPEPLREGGLTQYGVIIQKVIKTSNIDGTYYDNQLLKHFKCYEEVKTWTPSGYIEKIEITDPKQLQSVWEAIRGEEPVPFIRKGYQTAAEYYHEKENWQNFTLKEGTYQINNDKITQRRLISEIMKEDAEDGLYDDFDIVSEFKFKSSKKYKILPDNNGWISVERELPAHGIDVLVWLRQVDDFDIDKIGTSTSEEAFKRYYSHWKIPQPPKTLTLKQE